MTVLERSINNLPDQLTVTLESSILLHAGFEVLTDLVMKKSVFWDITPGSPLEIRLF
jgi:hypothetical protein